MSEDDREELEVRRLTIAFLLALFVMAVAAVKWWIGR